MMTANLKSFHKIFIAGLLFSGCGTNAPTPKCQAVIVVDKTSSMGYANQARLEQKIAHNIEQTYAAARSDIQLSVLKIKSNTQVIPTFDRFEEKYPDEEDGGRTYEDEVRGWKAREKTWITDEERQIDSLIENPCLSRSTDIFSTFKGIQETQKNNGPWDSVNVYILSDMINTSGTVNLNRMSPNDTPFSKGKSACRDLITQGQLSAGNTENLRLVVYTPGNMQNSGPVIQFWEGFFEQWGLKDSQYQFENE